MGTGCAAEAGAWTRSKVKGPSARSSHASRCCGELELMASIAPLVDERGRRRGEDVPRLVDEQGGRWARRGRQAIALRLDEAGESERAVRRLRGGGEAVHGGWEDGRRLRTRSAP
jgi:hypothetical protein